MVKDCENPLCSNRFSTSKYQPNQKYCKQKKCRNSMQAPRSAAYRQKVKDGHKPKKKFKPVVKDALYYLDRGVA